VRDPKRIGVILEKLGVVWAQYPDWRLGQVISNVLDLGDEDVFYVEDSRLDAHLDDYIERRVAA
jgi:hypothetical protein